MHQKEYILYRARTMHPLMQLLLGLITVAVLGVMLFLGLAFFAVIAGLAALVGLGLWLRLKWLQFRGRSFGHESIGGVERMAPSERVADAIEGDYQVVDRNGDDQA